MSRVVNFANQAFTAVDGKVGVLAPGKCSFAVVVIRRFDEGICGKIDAGGINHEICVVTELAYVLDEVPVGEEDGGAAV